MICTNPPDFLADISFSRPRGHTANAEQYLQISTLNRQGIQLVLLCLVQ